MSNWTIRVRPGRSLFRKGWWWELRASGYRYTYGWARTREKAEARAAKAIEDAEEIRALRAERERLQGWEDVT